MSRIAYVNGRYLPHAAARISIDDRGYLFADGVYEVIEVNGGALIDEALHTERLSRSLSETSIQLPLARSALGLVVREVVRRNRVYDGMVYLQITRGAAMRDHMFPDPPVRPSLLVTARSIDARALEAKAKMGIKVVTLPDLRWKRPDIKSISLLPNVLAKQQAKERSAAEAWLIGSAGFVSEGAASNAWIVDADGKVITHPVDRCILRGVTRTTLLDLLAAKKLVLEERPFSVEEAYHAKEAFITGATMLVMPVVAIDDRTIGDGRPGPVATDLRLGFHDAAKRSSLA